MLVSELRTKKIKTIPVQTNAAKAKPCMAVKIAENAENSSCHMASVP